MNKVSNEWLDCRIKTMEQDVEWLALNELQQLRARKEYPAYRIDCDTGDITRIDNPVLDIEAVITKLGQLKLGYTNDTICGVVKIEDSVYDWQSEFRTILENAMKGEKNNAW